eukprot:jgi/Psemu1/305837/fgenesh1_kg.221_\
MEARVDPVSRHNAHEEETRIVPCGREAKQCDATQSRTRYDSTNQRTVSLRHEYGIKQSC